MGVPVEGLAVGSGGGGGGNGGGGGGGGKVVPFSCVLVPGQVYPVVVGAKTAKGSANVNGRAGNPTSFNGFYAPGGGYGATSNLAGGSGPNAGGGGANGGLGLGAEFNGGAGNGSANNNYGGGGGAGAGQNGYDSNASLGANKSRGGNGVQSDIDGTPTNYGGAGGGGGYIPFGASAGLGGDGGGGNGATSGAGQDGVDGLGGGGGGGQGASSVTSAGGAGTAIIRYKTADWKDGLGGTITTSGEWTIHKFTSSGDFTAPVSKVESPTNLLAGSPSASSIPLTFDSPAAPATRILFYISETNDSGTAVLAGATVVGDEAYALADLEPETTYYIWAKAETATGELSGFSNGVSASTIAATLPDPPTALDADAVDRHSVSLTWTDEPAATLYHVEMSVGPGFGSWVPIGLAAQGDGGFDVAGLAAATAYRFRVRSENANGVGDPSAVQQVSTPAAPAASALVVTAPAPGMLRLDFDDDVAGEAGYIGYIATVNDFTLATQFGFAPAAQGFVEASSLPAGTQHWLWLVAVDALGFGATTGPATGTTAPATVPGQLLVTQLRAALRAFVKSAVPDREVIWLYEDGPKPAKGFVGLNLVGPTKPGQDEQLPGQTAGPRAFSLTVRCFNDKQDVALQDAMDIQSAMDRVDLLAPLQAAGYAFGAVGRILDTSGLLGTKWEARREFEAEVNASSLLAVSDGEIETITLGNGLPAEP
jgi:hypothetical protein